MTRIIAEASHGPHVTRLGVLLMLIVALILAFVFRPRGR